MAQLSAAAGAVAALLGLSSAEAASSSMRCSGKLVYAGGGRDSSHMYEVLKKCGEPVARRGNTWVYVQGSQQRLLTFDYQGRLQRIETSRS